MSNASRVRELRDKIARYEDEIRAIESGAVKGEWCDGCDAYMGPLDRLAPWHHHNPVE